ncbi:MAG: OmpA family protein [Nitrospiraceae bacterium]
MNKMVAKFGLVMAMAVVLLSAQGCSMKWLQSGGESESGSADSSYPGISRGGSSGELSGFSRNPSEERLAQSQGGFSASLTPSGRPARQRAELTREEKAAIEAGLHDVFFGYDQWTVSDMGMEALNRDAAYLKDHPGTVLKIEGHCDERGTTDYNMVLGDKRAKAARSYLVEFGVSPKQVAIVSFGKERPFCFDHEEACYQQNRRGHMLLDRKK